MLQPVQRMSKILQRWVIAVFLASAFSLGAAEVRVVKVLPLLQDTKGRTAVAPSLFERDAYQADLRRGKETAAGMIFQTQVKIKNAPAAPLKIKLEARPATINDGTSFVTEQKLEKQTAFSGWISIAIGQVDWKKLKGVSAWRITIWEGDKMVAEQKSFLW